MAQESTMARIKARPSALGSYSYSGPTRTRVTDLQSAWIRRAAPLIARQDNGNLSQSSQHGAISRMGPTLASYQALAPAGWHVAEMLSFLAISDLVWRKLRVGHAKSHPEPGNILRFSLYCVCVYADSLQQPLLTPEPWGLYCAVCSAAMTCPGRSANIWPWLGVSGCYTFQHYYCCFNLDHCRASNPSIVSLIHDP